MSLNLAVTPQPHVLTVAGSDCSGGAGIQADLKTIAALGGYGSSVLTALTAQNTLGVQGVHVVPPEFVVKQLRSIFDDLPPVAVKFGMLAGAATIKAVTDFFASLPQGKRPFLVLDPVMISTSGHSLLDEDAHTALLSLIALVDVVTPNIPEALTLLGSKEEITSKEQMDQLATALAAEVGAKAVLLKGGHLALPASATTKAPIAVIEDFRETLKLPQQNEVVVDIYHRPNQEPAYFINPRIESSSTHGTGCTVSAALASAYALNPTGDITASIAKAIAYTQGAIASAYPLGSGHGPLNHAHLSLPRPLAPPTEANPTPFLSHLIKASPLLWNEYVQHPFVLQLGEGTLPLESFKHYIAQDYHYLKHYARAHALASYKANDFASITAFSEIALHIAKESEMHVAFCDKFGISREELLTTPESSACAAYARYILDVGAQGSVLDIMVAVLSCLVGYGEVGLFLRQRVKEGKAKMEGNPYQRWMEDYAGEEFMGAVRRGIAAVESVAARECLSAERLAHLTGIWSECVRLERDFWTMGMERSW